jgi:tetratricopeptide (TPR) repeat protein
MSGNRSVSIQKLNEKLKKNSKPAKPAEKKERFLLSPPKEQVGSTFRKLQDIHNTEDEEYQEATGDGYENENENYNEEYEPRHSESQIDRIREKEVRDQQAREDEYFDSLPIDAQIKELEEGSIQAIREGNYEYALEKLVRCEQIIKAGLPSHDPQQIYIQYLLGECYLKLEEYDEAQTILERAVNSYEVND